jgi:tetrahydromethanopterin S-methyltransferase subunit C
MILGVAIAFIAFSFESFNAVILGVVVGYLFGSLLYNLLVKVVHINPQALYWSTLFTCIIGISIAGGFMDAYMVCLATSLVGAYAFVRVNHFINKGNLCLRRRLPR